MPDLYLAVANGADIGPVLFAINQDERIPLPGYEVNVDAVPEVITFGDPGKDFPAAVGYFQAIVDEDM